MALPTPVESNPATAPPGSPPAPPASGGFPLPAPPPRRRRRRWARVVAALLILSVAAGGAYWYRRQRNRAAAAGPAQFATAIAERGTLVVEVRGFGPLEPAGEREVAASFDGVVGEVAVQKGQKVEEGDLLFTILNDQLRLELEQAEIDYALKRQELADLMQVEPGRLSSVLAEEGLTARAPVAGRVVDFKAKPGEQVAEGATVATIVDDRRLRGQVRLTPMRVDAVRAGQPVEFRFRDFPGAAVPGRVVDVNRTPVVGEGSFYYLATVEVENPGLLKPGMEAEAVIAGEQGPFSAWLTFDRWAREERVKAPAPGVVEEVMAGDGMRVSAGDPLFRLERAGALTALRRKQLALRQAELSLELKRKQVASLEVRSPIDGVVAELEATPGKKAELGKALAYIADYSTMTLNLTVDELDIPKLRLDQDVTVTADALPGRTYRGKVISIGSRGQQREGISAFTVQVRVFEPEGLQAGMTARASIFVGQKRNVVMVPMEAVYDEQGQAMVQLLVDGNVRPVPVQVGLSNGRHAEILSGVEPGQTVVTGSSTPLFPQQRFGPIGPAPAVRVAPGGSPPRAPAGPSGPPPRAPSGPSGPPARPPAPPR